MVSEPSLFGNELCILMARSNLEHKSSAFRRFKSLPVPFCSLENSPQKLAARGSPLSPPLSPSLERSLTPEEAVDRPSFFLGSPEKDEKASRSPDGKHVSLLDHDESSQDSGVGLEKDDKDKGSMSPFIKPLGPAPRRARACSENASSPYKMLPRGILQRRSSTPDFNSHLLSPVLHKDDSPVKLKTSSLTLTPEEDDGDDGFLELGDDENQENDMPIGLQNLMSKPLLSSECCNSMNVSQNTYEGDFTPGLSRVVKLTQEDDTKKKTSFKRGLFRSPSMFERNPFKDIYSSNKRLSPCRDEDTPQNLKRRRSVVTRATPEKNEARPRLQRSQSEAFIKSALDRSSQQEPLIGDCSRPYALPTTAGKHTDLKYITPLVMSQLLNDEFSHVIEKFGIIDCRYPYEYKGGHIGDAINIWDRDMMMQEFMRSDIHRQDCTEPSKRRILILHCEFSSERGPKLSRFLRNMDRQKNKDSYPYLHYPELYLLEGGYKAFYQHFPTLCVPNTYLPMNHEKHLDDLKHFRAKSKSWAGEKSTKNSRMNLRKLMM